jgi:hypothetical protein
MNHNKWAAANERFCVIAAVTPQIMQCKLASYYPAASSVEAATTQSRRTLQAIEFERSRKKGLKAIASNDSERTESN